MFKVDLTRSEGYINYVAKNTHKAWLIRHGSTELNKPDPNKDRIRGWIDVPLNEQGRKEALIAGDFVKKLNIKKVLTSDLKRAVETADIINGVTPITIIRQSEFRPWKFGPSIEGQITSTVLAKIAYHVVHPDEFPPEGESFNTYKKRTIDAYNQSYELAKNETFGIVAHYRTLVLLDSWRKAGKDGYSIDVANFLAYASDVKPGHVMTID